MYKANVLYLDEMRKQTHSAKTLPLLLTSTMPSLAKTQRTTTIKRKKRLNLRQKYESNRKHCQVCKTAFIFTFITVMIVLSENCFLFCVCRCLVNIYTNSGYIYDLCHWSITGIEFVKKTFLRLHSFSLISHSLEGLEGKHFAFIIPRAKAE